MTAGLFATSRSPRRRWLGILFLLTFAAVVIGVLMRPPQRRFAHAPPPPPPPVASPSQLLEIVEPEPAPEPDPGYRVVRGGGDAFFLQIADGRVYWSGNGGLWSAPLVGDEPPRHIVGGWVLTFHVEGEWVTYTTSNAVMRARVDGSVPAIPMTLANEVDDPIEIVSDGRNVYYSMFRERVVHRIPWKGGESRRFGVGGPSWTIALDGDYLYVAEYGKGQVVKRPLRGGRDIVLAKGLKRPVGIVVDERDVFIACERDGTLRRVSKRGGRVATLATKQFNHDILAVDDTYVYWGDWGTHALMRARKDGSKPAEVLLAGVRNVVGVAVNETHVAFTSEGRVLVMAK